MFKLVVCVSIFIVTVAADYDFQDADFNKFLLDDFSVDFDYDAIKRHKRSADKPKGPSPDPSYQCCREVRRNDEAWKPIKEVKMKCILELRSKNDTYNPLSCHDVQTKRQQMVCIGECIDRKLDLIDENGDLKRGAMLEHSRVIVGVNKWKAKRVEKYVDMCLNELKSSKKMKGGFESDRCNPYPLEFHHCIWRKFFLGCPSKLRIQSEGCKNIRKRLAKVESSYSLTPS